jgi:hypothetical protein
MCGDVRDEYVRDVLSKSEDAARRILAAYPGNEAVIAKVGVLKKATEELRYQNPLVQDDPFPA